MKTFLLILIAMIILACLLLAAFSESVAVAMAYMSLSALALFVEFALYFGNWKMR